MSFSSTFFFVFHPLSNSSHFFVLLSRISLPYNFPKPLLSFSFLSSMLSFQHLLLFYVRCFCVFLSLFSSKFSLQHFSASFSSLFFLSSCLSNIQLSSVICFCLFFAFSHITFQLLANCFYHFSVFFRLLVSVPSFTWSFFIISVYHFHRPKTNSYPQPIPLLCLVLPLLPSLPCFPPSPPPTHLPPAQFCRAAPPRPAPPPRPSRELHTREERVIQGPERPHKRDAGRSLRKERKLHSESRQAKGLCLVREG